MTLIERINSFVNAVASDIKSLYSNKVNKTDVIAVAQGGTGATSASEARTNLGLDNIALKNISEVLNNNVPNATIPVVGIQPSRSDTNVDIVVNPKGTGAILAQVPDNTWIGGNKRGNYAVDLQMGRYNATQVASGQYSFAGGYCNTAKGLASTAFGEANTVMGNYATCAGYNNIAYNQGCVVMGVNNAAVATQCVAMGINNTCSESSSVALGDSNIASHLYTAAFGRQAKTRTLTSLVFGGGINFQTQIVTISKEISAANSLNYPVLVNSLRHIKGKVLAKSNDNTNFAVWDIDAIMTCGATTSTNQFLGTPNITLIGATSGASSWTCNITSNSVGLIANVDPYSTASKWMMTLYVQEIY